MFHVTIYGAIIAEVPSGGNLAAFALKVLAAKFVRSGHACPAPPTVLNHCLQNALSMVYLYGFELVFYLHSEIRNCGFPESMGLFETVELVAMAMTLIPLLYTNLDYANFLNTSCFAVCLSKPSP